MKRAFLCGLIAAIPIGLAAYQLSPSSFHIAILDGENAINNINGRVAQEPIVQVTDENHKPVKGAYVTFDGPKSGPGVAFAAGALTAVIVTDELGRAVLHDMKPNGESGSFDIHVHVTYQGQPIGEAVIHETNAVPKVANLANGLQQGGSTGELGALGGAGVLGVAIGPLFDLNGSQVPDNANLMANSEVVSLDKTVRVHLKDDCDYLLAPNSAARIEDQKLILEHGKVRARHAGHCKVGAAAWLIGSDDPGADGVISYSGGNLEVASLSGPLEVTGGDGTLAGTIAPGGYSAFGAGGQVAAGASGATAGVGPVTTGAAGGHLGLYVGTLAVVLAGLGLAVDAILQPGSPTSP